MLKLRILGNNSAAFAFGRHTSSQVIQNDSESFMVDCGEATQLQMQKYGVRPSKLNHIFISHLHSDHFLGLAGLISTMSLHGRKDTLHVYGQKGLDEYLSLVLKLSQTILSYDLKFHLIEITQKKKLLYESNILEVFAFPLKHRVNCTGFLFREKERKKLSIIPKSLPENIESAQVKKMREAEHILDEQGNIMYDYRNYTEVYQPKSYAYCSDTIYDENIISFIKGVDLLYHESTFLESESQRAKQTFHSTAQEAGKIAQLSEVKKLLLGHFSSRYRDLIPFLAEAKRVFIRTELSLEGQVYEII